MLFCPVCETILIFQTNSNSNFFGCQTCPFQFPLKRKFTNQIEFQRKNFNEIIQQQEKNLPTMNINCSKCDNNLAYYVAMQTRSIDEATTIFYYCTKCNYSWKEN